MRKIVKIIGNARNNNTDVAFQGIMNIFLLFGK